MAQGEPRSLVLEDIASRVVKASRGLFSFLNFVKVFYMNTILSFQSDKTHYTADACIVWCFDDRFSKLLDEYIKQQNFAHVDLVKVAGGAKDLASPDGEHARAYLLDQIAKSIKLHHTKEIILMMQSDCGAYGGNTASGNYSHEI